MSVKWSNFSLYCMLHSMDTCDRSMSSAGSSAKADTHANATHKKQHRNSENEGGTIGAALHTAARTRGTEVNCLLGTRKLQEGFAQPQEVAARCVHLVLVD